MRYLHGGGIPERTILVRFPGGFWSHAGWRLHEGPYWGTTSIEGFVAKALLVEKPSDLSQKPSFPAC